MNETMISVPEIHCDHCKTSLEGAIGALAGVKSVEVDVPTATIAVAYGDPATMDDLVAAIEAQGYDVASG
jgi:copper chaperone